MAKSTVREIFEKGTDAFNAHDIEAFARLMADDVTARAPGDVDLTGKPAVQGFYKAWLDGFPDARVDVSAVHILDDAAVEEGVFSGTHSETLRSPSGDLPATGRTVRVEYIQVLRFRNTRIVSFHLVFDRAALFDQLGLMPRAEAHAEGAWRGHEPEATQPH